MIRLSKLLILSMLAVTTMAKGQITLRQQSFPVALPMTDDNVEWQRDVYRDILLTDEHNAGLYSPTEPSPNQKGLFTTLFALAVNRMIPVYKYVIDGNEVFNEVTKMDIKDVLTNQHIYFTEEDGSIVVEPEDIPSSEVMEYYIKEGVYYDLTNSSFRIRVLALCPVLIIEDDFTDGPTKYPLFWVEYKDLEPFIEGLTIIPDYGNRAAAIPMTDYFTLNRYKGKIYKVSNAFGHTLMQQCGSDSLLEVRQQQLERELRGVRTKTYNTYANPNKTVNQKQPPEPKKKRRTFPWQKSDANRKDSEQ